MRTHGKDARRRGAAMVEMALVLTLLLLLVLGTIEYGWLFLTMQKMTNAARHGARIQAALGAAYTDGTHCDGYTQMMALVSDIPTAAAPTGSVTTSGDLVTATITVTTAGVRLVNWDLLPAPPTLTATVKMAKEGGS